MFFSISFINHVRVCEAILADQPVGDVLVKLLNQLAAGNGLSLYLRSCLHETAAILSKKADHVKVIQSRALASLRKAVSTTILGRPRHSSAQFLVDSNTQSPKP